MLTENELWLLSLYRASEIGGSLFFGRLARVLRPGRIQIDLSRHFADEAQHAWYWTRCIDELGAEPLKLDEAYQDRYVAVTGVPANLMEVLAITKVFEQRTIDQYARHMRVPGLRPAVSETIERIMQDERWHLQWVHGALRTLEDEYGRERIEATLRRLRAADHEVFEQVNREHGQRLDDLAIEQGGNTCDQSR